MMTTLMIVQLNLMLMKCLLSHRLLQVEEILFKQLQQWNKMLKLLNQRESKRVTHLTMIKLCQHSQLTWLVIPLVWSTQQLNQPSNRQSLRIRKPKLSYQLFQRVIQLQPQQALLKQKPLRRKPQTTKVQLQMKMMMLLHHQQPKQQLPPSQHQTHQKYQPSQQR